MTGLLLLFLTLSSANHIEAATFFTIREVKPSGTDVKADPLSLITTSSMPSIPKTPTTDSPIMDSHVTDSPVTNSPVTDTPVTDSPINDSTITDSPFSEYSATNTPVSKSSITNSPTSISSSINTSDTKTKVPAKNQARKSIKPLFGLVGTKDFFKILETPMIYRPPPVYTGPFSTTTISPYLNPLRRNSNLILCQDFVTPILTAAIRNLTYPYIVTSKDHFIARVLRLLHTDTSTATEDDIKTMVWQISNLDIRLYQWSALAMTKLLNTITLHNEEDHWTLDPKLRSFANFKKELEGILMSWRLDLSDTEPILRDSKIIRPPCCCGNTLGQSTYAPTVTVITTKSTKADSSLARMGPVVHAVVEEEVEYEDDSIETSTTATAIKNNNHH